MTPTKKAILFFSAVIAVIMVLGPVYLLVKYALSDVSSINTGGQPLPLWPYHPTFRNFLYLFSDRNFYAVVLNSLFIASATVGVSMALGVPASYVLARIPIPGKSALLIGLISVRLFPDIASVVPVTELFLKLNIQNTYVGVILAHTLLALPYVIFIGTSAFEPIPRDLEQQAITMGANGFQVFFRVVLPLAIPGLIAAAIYTFLLSWDEFIFAYFLLGLGKLSTLTLYLKQKMTYAPPQNILAAISVFLSVPVVVMSLALQRYMTAGITSGAVK